jgi:SAM-dependent methyltransferase
MSDTMTAAETHAGAQHFCRTVRTMAGVPAEPRVLVAGCGRGHEALYIRSTLGGSLVGVDIDRFWDPLLGSELDDFRLDVASVQELPHDDESFDVVFFHHVIEHVDDPAASLAELARVLRPGGVIYIGTPNRHRLVGYLGSYDATTAQKVRWNLKEYGQRVTGRFRNELGAHAGFSAAELRGLLGPRFTDLRFLTDDYLRFKYGARLPGPVLSAVCANPVREVAAPSVYVTARRR